jgi:hypothetical protein
LKPVGDNGGVSPLLLPAPERVLALPAPAAALEVPLGPTGPVVSPDPAQPERAAHRLPNILSPAQRQLLAGLQAGDPFDAKVKAAFLEILGTEVNRGGLLALYGAAVPDKKARIYTSAEKDHVAFTITWVDNLGGTLATLRRKLRRHDDGALELYGHAQWVAPELRGLGVAAQIFQSEVELLKACSSHPKSRLTLWAGSMADPRQRAETESVGKYVWANFGYDFHELAGPRSSLATTADKPRIEDDEPGTSDRALMRRQLKRWLAGEVEAGRLPDAIVSALGKKIERLQHPWEVATLAVSLGGERQTLGKAFLLSKLAPRWEGAFWVQGKGKAQGLAKDYVAQQRRGVEDRRLARSDALLAKLNTPDPEALKKVLLEVGRYGGERCLSPLRSLAHDRPELAAEIETAILQIEGKWVPPRPAPVYYSGGGLRDPGRFEIPAEFKALENATIEELADKVVEGERRLATAALDIMVGLHLKDEAPTCLAAATFLYDRFPGDDHWWARRSAVAALGKLPDEAGLPALIERSTAEDDINVMIALHQQLDRAENPAAEAPAAALLVRIDVMKAEIERALAEL